MKKIAIFQKDLRVGGIQKSLVNLLGELDTEKLSVDVYLFDTEHAFELPQHENISYIYRKPYPFFYKFIYFDILRRIAPVPAENVEYDLAIDFNSYSGECAVGALSVKAKKRVMWVHNDVDIKLKQEPKYAVLWHFFRGKLRYYDEFCAVSPGIIDGFKKRSGLKDAKFRVIQNRISAEDIFTKAEEKVDFAVDEKQYNLCTLGRLCHMKGFDIMLQYMQEIHRRRSDIHLYMIGDGPDRGKLQELIEKYGLQSCVSMLGSKANPFPYLARMDGFAFTSRYEGQGMVVLEAKALGLQLFVERHLEKYNPGIECCDSIVEAICAASRQEKKRDDLREYNDRISDEINKLFGL